MPYSLTQPRPPPPDEDSLFEAAEASLVPPDDTAWADMVAASPAKLPEAAELTWQSLPEDCHDSRTLSRLE